MLPGIEYGCVVDSDETIVAVFGSAKQGAEHDYTNVRGLNAQVVT